MASESSGTAAPWHKRKAVWIGVAAVVLIVGGIANIGHAHTPNTAPAAATSSATPLVATSPTAIASASADPTTGVDAPTALAAVQTNWGDCLVKLGAPGTPAFKANKSSAAPLGWVTVPVKGGEVTFAIGRSNTGSTLTAPTAASAAFLNTVGC